MYGAIAPQGYAVTSVVFENGVVHGLLCKGPAATSVYIKAMDQSKSVLDILQNTLLPVSDGFSFGALHPDSELN